MYFNSLFPFCAYFYSISEGNTVPFTPLHLFNSNSWQIEILQKHISYKI